ncbi:hypothetical protein D3C80_1896930 [compost metagenome]
MSSLDSINGSSHGKLSFDLASMSAAMIQRNAHMNQSQQNVSAGMYVIIIHRLIACDDELTFFSIDTNSFFCV